jgi:hypothetical protein
LKANIASRGLGTNSWHWGGGPHCITRTAHSEAPIVKGTGYEVDSLCDELVALGGVLERLIGKKSTGLCPRIRKFTPQFD